MLRGLAESLRFAPAPSLLRQADHAEALAAEIDAARSYPESWLVYRITGFTPDGDADALLRGTEVLVDLSSLVEALTDRAGLSEGDAAAGGLGVDELTARWGVTRRTIERFRREGLVARRVASPGTRGRARLVFSVAAVRAFESRRGLAPGAEAGKPRMAGAERTRCAAWGARFAARTGCSLHEAARRLARREGGSVATMRRLLQREAMSAFPPTGSLSAQEDRFAWAALRAGATPARIGARLGRSAATVLRAANRHRAALLRGVGASSEAVRPGAGGTEWEPAWWPESWEGWVGAARSHAVMAAETERALLRVIAGALHRAAQTNESASASDLDRTESALRAATSCKARLVLAQSGLVMRTIEASAQVHGASAALRRAGILALADAIDRFEGEGRLAAPVSLALARVIAARRGPKSGPDPGSHAFPQLEDLCPWERWLAPPAWVRRGAEKLDASDRSVLLAKWGHDGRAPMDARAIRVIFGVTPQRWAALYRRACALGRWSA